MHPGPPGDEQPGYGWLLPPSSGSVRAMRPSALVPVFILAISSSYACGGPAIPETDVVDELAAPGPHAVGYRSVSVRYTPPHATSPRMIQVLAWYPAQPATGERPIYLLRPSTVATTDAPPLDLGPRPVVVFTHGHQAYASVVSYLMEHLASHGYIVLSPSHTGNTFVDGPDRTNDIYWLRPLDVRAALDYFLTASDAPPIGKLGPDAVVMGHSFGGYTAFAAAGARYAVDELVAACRAGTGDSSFCKEFDADAEATFRAGLADARFRGVISIDPGNFDLFGAAGVAQVHVPTLMMVAELSGHPAARPAADPYWSALTGTTDTRALLLGGDHNDFMDTCASGVEVRCSKLPPPQVWRPVRIYSLAFLRALLDGDQRVAPILSGTRSISPLFEVIAR